MDLLSILSHGGNGSCLKIEVLGASTIAYIGYAGPCPAIEALEPNPGVRATGIAILNMFR
jgi:hypothetical protein